MIKHLIFDFDGTISDSYPHFMDIFHRLAQKHGWEIPVDEEGLLQALLVSVKAAHRQFGWDRYISYPDFWNAFEELQVEKALEFKAFPAAVELLKHATEQGIQCYIYTHSGKVVAEKMLKNMQVDQYITYTIDKSMDFPPKPAPDALQFLIEKFNLPAKECMMIGDRPIDAQAGMNAGMKGCLWDQYGIFADATADLYVRHLEEIKNHL